MSRKLWIDGIALLVYIVVSLPGLTGVAAHEWLGLAIFVVLAVHLAQHLTTLAPKQTKNRAARITRTVLAVALGISLMVVMVSGLMVSGAVLPTFGYYAEGYYFWNPLHAIFAKILLALFQVHLFVNIAPAQALWRKYRAKKETATSAELSEQER